MQSLSPRPGQGGPRLVSARAADGRSCPRCTGPLLHDRLEGEGASCLHCGHVAYSPATLAASAAAAAAARPGRRDSLGVAELERLIVEALAREPLTTTSLARRLRGASRERVASRVRALEAAGRLVRTPRDRTLRLSGAP